MEQEQKTAPTKKLAIRWLLPVVLSALVIALGFVVVQWGEKQQQKAKIETQTGNFGSLFYLLIEYDQEFGHLPDKLQDLETSGLTKSLPYLLPKDGKLDYYGGQKSTSSNTSSILVVWKPDNEELWLCLRLDSAVATYRNKRDLDDALARHE